MMGLPSCTEVHACMTDYMEGALPWRKRLGVRIHLLMCKACAGLYDGLRALSSRARNLFAPPSPEPPPEANAAHQNVLDTLRNQGKP
jgi:anti-sigma factor RsiW